MDNFEPKEMLVGDMKALGAQGVDWCPGRSLRKGTGEKAVKELNL